MRYIFKSQFLVTSPAKISSASKLGVESQIISYPNSRDALRDGIEHRNAHHAQPWRIAKRLPAAIFLN